MSIIDSTIIFAITEFDKSCAIVFALSSFISVMSFFSARTSKKEYELMSATKTSSVRDLKSGPAEVAGCTKVKTAGIRSPWSNRECVYYRFQVDEAHKNGWSTLIDDTAPSSFLVEDETGEIEILVSEGEMDLRVDRQSESGYGNDAPDQLRNLLTSRYDKDTQWFGFNRTLRYIETYLEPGDKVYVFGQASQADDGRWVMRDGEMPLIVSERSELDVETQTKKDSRFWPTIVSAIIAVGVAV